MAKKRSIEKRPSSRDPLEVQISIRFKAPKGTQPEQLTAALYDEVIKYRIENGVDHPAFTSKIIRWKNPARAGKKGAWRQGNQSDAWDTLGKQLRFATIDVIGKPRRRR